MAQIKSKFITDNAVTNAKLAQAAAFTIKGNDTASTANVADLTVSQVNSLLGDILADGSVAFSADQSMGSFKLTNVADPLSAQDAATKAYVDSVSDGRSWKQPVRVASTADISLILPVDPSPVDGVTLADGDRIVLKNQTAGEENGIYDAVTAADPTTWVRSSDADTALKLEAAAVFVEEGTASHDYQFAQTADSIVLGTTPLVWVVTSANSFSGHDMISLVGGQISVDLATASGLESTNPGNAAGQLRIKLEASNPSLKFSGSNELGAKLDAAGAILSGASGLAVQVDNSTIEINTNAIRVKTGGITNTQVSASAAIAYSKLSLANSIVNADIATGAAIAYSKLNLSASIVNADIASGAAIAYSKLNLANSVTAADQNSGAALSGQVLTANGSGGATYASPAASAVGNEEHPTLSGTDITNQYFDLAHVASGASASVNSISLDVVGGPEQLKGVDYTVSLTGGAGGVTRITFAGDLATGGNAELVAGDILMIKYSY